MEALDVSGAGEPGGAGVLRRSARLARGPPSPKDNEAARLWGEPLDWPDGGAADPGTADGGGAAEGAGETAGEAGGGATAGPDGTAAGAGWAAKPGGRGEGREGEEAGPGRDAAWRKGRETERTGQRQVRASFWFMCLLASLGAALFLPSFRVARCRVTEARVDLRAECLYNEYVSRLYQAHFSHMHRAKDSCWSKYQWGCMLKVEVENTELRWNGTMRVPRNRTRSLPAILGNGELDFAEQVQGQIVINQTFPCFQTSRKDARGKNQLLQKAVSDSFNIPREDIDLVGPFYRRGEAGRWTLLLGLVLPTLVAMGELSLRVFLRSTHFFFEVLPCVAILCNAGGRIIVHVLRDLVDDTFLGFYRTLSVFLVLYLLVGSGMVSLHATNVEIAERGRLLTELANNLRRKEGRLNC